MFMLCFTMKTKKCFCLHFRISIIFHGFSDKLFGDETNTVGDRSSSIEDLYAIFSPFNILIRLLEKNVMHLAFFNIFILLLFVSLNFTSSNLKTFHVFFFGSARGCKQKLERMATHWLNLFENYFNLFSIGIDNERNFNEFFIALLLSISDLLFFYVLFSLYK